jgi:hypothetical protein
MVELESSSVEDLALKCGISFEPKPMRPVGDHPYIIIRHGISEYNVKDALIKDLPNYTELKAAVRSDFNLVDCRLHSMGIKKCEAYIDTVNTINFKKVFVSPLRRAMMTAIHMFKKHPNKENIRFVVLPMAREVLNSANDISILFKDLRA